jgi:hypothetical protein
MQPSTDLPALRARTSLPLILQMQDQMIRGLQHVDNPEGRRKQGEFHIPVFAL